MWYAIEARDGENSLPKRQAARPAHLARLQGLLEQGRLFVAGACPNIDNVDPGDAGFSGSIIIAEFDSLEAAKAWAQADPFVAAGVYASVEVRPFRKALP